jgi:hypothetical protein
LGQLAAGSNSAIPVGQSGTPAPANAFAGLLSLLARAAEAEALAWDDSESVPAYLVGPSGDLAVDPADPDQRSARLWHLLATQPTAAADRDAEVDPDLADYDDAEPDDVDIDIDVLPIDESLFRLGDELAYQPARW